MLKQLRKKGLLTKKQNARIGKHILVFASCPKATDESIMKIFTALDKVKEKYNDLSLVTFGGNYASDKTAHNWAEKNEISVLNEPLSLKSWDISVTNVVHKL